MIKDGKYIAPTKWEECGRDDLKAIPLMEANGFTPIFSYNDRRAGRTTIEAIPHDTVSFGKGDLHVWKVYNYQEDGMYFSWMSAKVVNNEYVDHLPVKILENLFK